MENYILVWKYFFHVITSVQSKLFEVYFRSCSFIFAGQHYSQTHVWERRLLRWISQILKLVVVFPSWCIFSYYFVFKFSILKHTVGVSYTWYPDFNPGPRKYNTVSTTREMLHDIMFISNFLGLICHIKINL